MDNKNVVIDIKSIESTKKILDDNYTALLELISKYKEMVEDTKRIYDTESGTMYRTLAISYLELIERYLNNDFKPYIDRLDEINKSYMSVFNDVSQSIGGGSE